MARLKNNLILAGLFLCFSFYTAALNAEIWEDGSIKEIVSEDSEAEIVTSDASAPEIHLQQGEIYPPATPKSSGRGKSILLDTPRTKRLTLQDVHPELAQTENLKGRVALIKTPKHISDLVKEVPKEIIEKKARLKNKAKHMPAAREQR